MRLPAKRFHVFVYGTLRPGGFYFKRLVEGLGVLSTPAWVSGELYKLDPGYPGLRPGERRVEGDVLSFDEPSLLDQLDELEGYDPQNPEAGEYKRGQIEAFAMSGAALGEVAVYWILPERLKELNGTPIDKWTVGEFGNDE